MEEYIEKAKMAGLDPEVMVREVLQKLILYGISYLNLDDHLIFQGETALRLVYGSPRFSLDMDFTLVEFDIEGIPVRIEGIRGLLDRVLSRDSISVSVSGEKVFRDEGFYRCFLVFDTSKLLGRKIRIKVEINLGKYAGIKFDKHVVDVEYPYRTSVGITVKSPSQILADKIASLAGGFHRNIVRWRDIFDIYWLKSRLNADLDREYFLMEFGSWIEDVKDLERGIQILSNMVDSDELDKAYMEFRRLLPPTLSKEDLVKKYLDVAIEALREGLEVLDSEAEGMA